MSKRTFLCAAGLTVVATLVAGQGAWAGETKRYTYDSLGQLIRAKSSGSLNNNQTQSFCYDDAGNRTHFRSNSNGNVANCSAPTPSHTLASTPGNKPQPGPVHINIPCSQTATISPLLQDTDPDGDYPLSLVSVQVTSGGAAMTKINSTQFQLVSQSTTAPSYGTYVVSDSRGATATGSITVSIYAHPMGPQC